MEQIKIDVNPTECWTDEKEVNGVRLPIIGASYMSCNALGVEVGTAGFCGGDSGHGSRTYFSLRNIADTDMTVSIDGKVYNPELVEFLFGGDCELETFIQSLEFALKILKLQANVKTEVNSKKYRQTLFFGYLGDLMNLYSMTGKLSGMSKLQTKYNITSLTQAQFFSLGLHQAVRDSNFRLTEGFANAVYDYVLDKSKSITMPNYQDYI